MNTSLRQIMDDIESFKERTDRLPKRDEEDPPRDGETWTAYEQVLRRVHGMTLRGLLDAEFGALNTKKRGLTLALVKRRGREHKKTNGVWPTRGSGQVTGEPEGETWLRWEGAVQQGLRGMEKRPSLAHVFTDGEPDELGNRAIRRGKGRTLNGVLELMRDFHERTGRWPTETDEDGKLESDHEETWRRLNRWLTENEDTTLVKLARKRLGAKNRNRPGPLDLMRLKREAKKFERESGRWPNKADGPINGWDGEAWGNVHKAMSTGKRDTDSVLPEAMTLRQFVDRYCAGNERLPGE